MSWVTVLQIVCPVISWTFAAGMWIWVWRRKRRFPVMTTEEIQQHFYIAPDEHKYFTHYGVVDRDGYVRVAFDLKSGAIGNRIEVRRMRFSEYEAGLLYANECMVNRAAQRLEIQRARELEREFERLFSLGYEQ